jgi:hypothetical protein
VGTSGLHRLHVVHTCSAFILARIIEQEEEESKPQDCGQGWDEEGDTECVPCCSSVNGVFHTCHIEEIEAVDCGENDLQDSEWKEHAPSKLKNLIGSNTSK